MVPIRNTRVNAWALTAWRGGDEKQIRTRVAFEGCKSVPLEVTGYERRKVAAVEEKEGGKVRLVDLVR